MEREEESQDHVSTGSNWPGPGHDSSGVRQQEYPIDTESKVSPAITLDARHSSVLVEPFP